MGRLMKEIRMTSAVSGLQSVRWNGDDMMQRKVASGIYLYKISAGTMILSGKMVLQK
jgi:peptidase E